MIPRQCKRLAEVDFPIAEVSRHAAREKSIRHGHPSTLHLWWARRPLASSRAILLALLLPDPSDPHCPPSFRHKAREILRAVRQPPTTNEELTRALLSFIASFANWDMAADPTYLRVARGLVRAAHEDDAPFVVDPFAGGGSIPLEALRLDCDAFATDLNPVACLILTVLLGEIPRRGPSLARELRRTSAEMKQHVEERLADFYPLDPDGATPVTYLWSRTVRCEAPECGAEVPIFRSPWLAKKGAPRARFFKEQADGPCRVLLFEARPQGGPITFRIASGVGSEESRPGFVELRGTKAAGNNANVVCPCCGSILSGAKKNPRVPLQLSAQRGGTDVAFNEAGRRTGGARLLAVVTRVSGKRGRRYRLANESDYAAVHRAQVRLQQILDEWEGNGRQGLCPVPDEDLPPLGTLGFRVQRYGMRTWGDLFTARQKLLLLELCRYAAQQIEDVALQSTVAMLIGRCADYGSSGTVWAQEGEFVAHTFGRQALPLVWDFAEAAQLTESSGSFEGALNWVVRVIEAWPDSRSVRPGQADARECPLPDQSADVWFTDPPYYDAVPYSDLSDFFLVWLKRAAPRSPFLKEGLGLDPENLLSPKTREIVQDKSKLVNGEPKDREWFEETIGDAFAEGRRILQDDGVGTVVFAHKTTEGWEALLAGMIRGGWTITGSWPVATERPGRLRSQNSAALATSVHLICRPRPDSATVGDWGEVLRELPERVADWMQRLQGEGVRGADLVFACIGPALEIFSRHHSVETAAGRSITLSEYLPRVWEAVGRSALRQVLDATDPAASDVAGALEEDSRLTALFLWTLQSTDPSAASSREERKSGEAVAKAAAKGFRLPFDVVRRFAQPMGISLDSWTGRIVDQKKGVVRLRPVVERGRDLFGERGAAGAAASFEHNPSASVQRVLFPEATEAAGPRSSRAKLSGRPGTSARPDAGPTLDSAAATTLDRLHAAMLLQSTGHTSALRRLIEAEQEQGSDFLRLANALSALYPRGCTEKRLLDAMLLAVPR